MDEGTKNKERALKKFMDNLDPEEQKRWESGDYYGENPKPMSGERLKAWNESRAKIKPTLRIKKS